MNKTQGKIIDALIEDNKLSATKLAERLQLNGRYIERNIQKLKEAGILIRHGSPKSGYWEVTCNPGKKEKDNF